MTTQQRPAARRAWIWLRQRTELGFALGVLAIAVFLTVGTITMDVPDGVGSPGPRFFPTIVAVFLYITGLLLAVDVIRRPNLHAGTGSSQFSTEMLQDFAGLDDADQIRRITRGRGARATGATRAAAGGATVVDDGARDDDGVGDPASAYVPVDWRTLGMVLAGLVLFTLLLSTVGWLICCAALFWLVSRALGSRRPLFDVAVAVIAASVIQLAFSAGLGLNLPGGVLEGAIPWTS